MNAPALATIAVLVCGALSSPALLAWASYCLTRPGRRAEGVTILGSGALTAGTLLIAGLITAPPDSPGLFRFQALVIFAGVFAIGAAAGKAIHFMTSRRRRATDNAANDAVRRG